MDIKRTKQFFSINNSVASNSNGINRMEYNFNNSTLTNIQTSHGQRCVFTPVNLSIDFDYKNISENYKNNKLSFEFTTGGYNNRIFTITDNSYSPLSLCAYLNTALNETLANGGIRDNADVSLVWIAEFNPLFNKILIRYTANVAVNVKITAYFVNGGLQYNATRWMGLTIASPSTPQQTGQQAFANGAFTNPLPSVYSPLSIDFKTIDTVRIHSNIAKRFFEIKSGRLTQNDVLFELIPPNGIIGAVFVWEPSNPDLYSQEVHSNFDNMVIELKDRTGNLIDFQSYCSFTMTFYIEREIEIPDPMERLKNLQNLNQLSSV